MFDAMPCIVELFGHQRIAGKVTEQTVAGSALLRVDVPAVDGLQPFSKFYGVAAIYAITPTDEATMLQAVRAFRTVPIDRWSLQIPERIPIRESGGQGDDNIFDDPFEDSGESDD